MLAVVALQKLWSRICSESKTCHQQNSHSDPKNLCGMFAVVKIWDLESTFKTSIYTHIYIYSNYNQLLPTLFGIKIDKTSLSARHSQYIYTELWWSQDHTSCISCPPTPLSLTLFRRVSYLRPLGKQLHSGKFFCFFQGFPGSMWFFPRNQQLEWKIQPPSKSGGFASPTWNGIVSFSSQTKTTWWLNQNKLGKYDRQNSKWESSPGNDKTNWQLKCGDNCGRFWVDHFVGEGLFDDEQAGKYRGMSEIYLI